MTKAIIHSVAYSRTVDVFLEKHRHLTEPEKEDLCGKVLGCRKLPREAVEHIADEREVADACVAVLVAVEVEECGFYYSRGVRRRRWGARFRSWRESSL